MRTFLGVRGCLPAALSVAGAGSTARMQQTYPDPLFPNWHGSSGVLGLRVRIRAVRAKQTGVFAGWLHLSTQGTGAV